MKFIISVVVGLCFFVFFLLISFFPIHNKKPTLREEFENTFPEFEEMRDLIQTDPDIIIIKYWTDNNFKIYFKPGKDVCSNFERYQAFFEKNKFVGVISYRGKKIDPDIGRKYNIISNEINIVFFTDKIYDFLLGYSLLYSGNVYSPELNLSILTEDELHSVGYKHVEKTKHEHWYRITY